jgi:hypothetical protein
MNIRPLQPQHLLSSQSRLKKGKKIFLLHLRWCLHNAPSSQDTTGWWNRFNLANNKFMTAFHFVVDSGSQKNLISTKLVKQFGLSTTPLPQPYNIGWLCQGRDLHVSQQCCMSYGIQPFKDEVVCDVVPLDVYDVVLGQPYMWKHHYVYESQPRSVIITLRVSST